MLIYGVHSCKSAVNRNIKNISRVYLLKNKEPPSWINQIPISKILKIQESELVKMLPKNTNHQGIAMDVNFNYEDNDITDLISSHKNCVIAMLDNVTDPHNLGAIIRTAAAFGVSGIVLPKKSSCKITGVVAKTASGGLEYTSIYIVKNLSHAIDKIKEYGFWVVSFCERGDKFLHDIDLNGKICLVLGSEGQGIRRLQKEKSDFIVKLQTKPEFPTLNVSTSAAIAFYEAAKQNNFDL